MPLIESADLDHVGYVVPDLEAAVDFFVNYLGFEQVGSAGPVQSTTDDSITQIYAMPEKAVGRFASLRKGNATIEFAEWKTYGEALNPLRESSAPGCHIALKVPDVESVLAILRSIQRMRILQADQDGSVYCFTPYGFLLKLIHQPLGA